MCPNRKNGKVFLIGAGPGDPGLITAAGLRRLREADAVVYDALANPRLLDEAPVAARRINAGKRGGESTLTQEQINDLLVELAGQGLRVVRLKGGDPLLFGRGAEEAAHLARHGIVCEIIAGVTSGIAAPAAAGIPVTHREHASTLTFVTGHEDPRKQESSVDYGALARLITSGGTACFYMSVGQWPGIAQALTSGGLGGDTPAAAVQWGTLPSQRSVRATVASLAQVMTREEIGTPAILVVGAVAGVNEAGLMGFVRRPLFGQRVLITRTRQQASVLHDKLAELGAEVLEAPTIELAAPPPEELARLDEAVRDIAQYDWVVLTSVNGVAALAQRLEAMSLDARHLHAPRFAAIGQPTAAALWEKLRVRADLVPAQFVAESLAERLIAQADVAGRRVLLLRADLARVDLRDLLAQAGASVCERIAYQTRRVPSLDDAALAALRQRRIDWVTFTSSSTATNLVRMLDAERSLLEPVHIASIGPVTSRTVRQLGLAVAAEAAVSTIDGLVEAIVNAAGDAKTPAGAG